MADTDPLDDIFGPETEGQAPAGGTPPAEPAQTEQLPGTEAQPAAAPTPAADPEDFWAQAGEPDEFVANPFMTPEEKAQAATEAWTLVALAVRDNDTEVGPTWFVDVVLPSGELRTLTLKNGQGLFSRDHYLGKAQEWFKTHQGARIPMRLAKQGRTWLLEAPKA